MSIAQLDTLYGEAVAAIDAEDYALAIRKLMAIKARLATTPNLSRSTGGGTEQISWNAAEINSLIADCRQQKAAAAHARGGPLRSTRITYARSTDVDSYA